MNLTALKKKNIHFLIISILSLIAGFVFYFLCVRTKPNDRIITDTSGNALFANENPTFTVNFGSKDQPQAQWIRFEASPSTESPFETKKSKNIFTKLKSIFLPTKKTGIEMSLKGVNFSETNNSSQSEYEEELKKVADILGTETITTSTSVAESGRIIGNSENDQNISKPTIINSEVSQGVDLEYQILEGKGLKEEIVIQNLDGFSEECKQDLSKCKLPLNEYTFDLKMDEGVFLNEGWYMVKGKTTKTYYFTDSNGNYLAHFLPNFAVDANGNETSLVNLDIKEKQQGEYEIKVTVDSEWLLSPDRSYPVRIDPSIVHDTSSDFGSGVFQGTRYITGSELQIFDTSIVGSWNMNEATNGTCTGGGDICDQSGNNYNATISGTATSVSSVDVRGRDFDGVNGTYASIGDNSAFETQSFTIEAWVKKEGTCGAFYYCSILSKGGSGREGFGLGLFGSSPILQLRVNDEGSDGLQHLNGTTVLSDNTWYYVAAVADGVNKSMKLYINGNLEASGQYSETINYGGASVKIGNANNNNDLVMNGVLDDVKFSNVAKDAAYIQNQYNKYAYGIYRSPIITIGGMQNITLSYLTSGTKTSDGETPYSTTGLLAQWNFNETSGITAVSGGTCGTACNGTLTSFGSTGSQDAAAGTGWTANNRRWGSGALMFDGTDDYVNVGDLSQLEVANVTISTWVKIAGAATNYWQIAGKMDSTAMKGYKLAIEGTTGKPYFQIGNGSSTPFVLGSQSAADGNWHNIVGTFDGTNMNLYIDGIIVGSNTSTAISYNTEPFTIGRQSLTTYYYLPGIMDSTTVYSRALTSTEILSNYNSGVIEFQVRGGNSTNPDDGTWSNWTTTANESSVNSFDNSYLYNTTDNGLVGYWPMDEISGASVADVKGSNSGTATGTTISTGEYSKGRTFNGTSDYVTMGNTKSTNMSISMWVYPTSWTNQTHMALVAERSTNTDGLMFFVYNKTTLNFDFGNGSASNRWDTGYLPPLNKWTHLVITRDSSGRYLYVNGKLQNSTTTAGGALTTTANLRFGADSQSAEYYYKGSMDEMRVYNTALSASEVLNLYQQGLTNQFLYQQQSGDTKIEGSNSNRLTINLNGGLVAYWNLNESSGSSLTDNVGGYTATATGTTVAAGKYGLGRSFGGSSDYISRASLTPYNTSRTVEFWFKPAATGSQRGILSSGNTTSDTSPIWLIVQTSGNLLSVYHGASYRNGTTTLAAGNWYHGAYTFDSSNNYVRLYLNGKLEYSGTVADSNINNTNLYIGTGYGGYFSGTIDEVKVFNVAKTADEILEEYNATSTYYTNYSLTSTDLSTKTSVPFYVAADKPGPYISATLGETAFANYQTDVNTVGLWHLDEVSRSGAYIKDSSGYDSNMTPSGTSVVNGKLGNGRYFNGTSDYIRIASSSFNRTNGQELTVQAWIKPSRYTGYQDLVANRSASVHNWILYMHSTDGSIQLHGASQNKSTYIPPLNTWTYIVATVDASGNYKLYANGQLVQSMSGYTYNSATPSELSIGNYGTAEYYQGSIDEVSVSNVARTAEQIRQAYEVGLRTLDINIQFGANLNSANLIANSSDLSFTIDAQKLGLPQAGSNLYGGDKLIVREVSDGTEYIAQGTVSSVGTVTGAVTVLSWDSGSTFPSGGFTANASVFKWEREFLPIAGKALSTQLDAISLLTLRVTNGYGGRNIWIDDLKSNSGYINTSGTAIDLGQSYQYTQYRAIFTTNGNVSPYLNQVQVDYVQPGPNMDQIMRHGKWFDSGGVKRTYWWIKTN